MNNRIYAPIAVTSSVDDLKHGVKQTALKGFAPIIISRPNQILPIDLNQIYSFTVTLDSLKKTTHDSISSILCGSEMSEEPNNLIKLFHIAGKQFEESVLLEIVEAELAYVSETLTKLFLSAENSIEIGTRFNLAYQVSFMIDLMLSKFPFVVSSFDIIFEKMKRTLSLDDKKIISQKVIKNFITSNDSEMAFIKSAINFLVRIDIFDYKKIISKILKHLEQQKKIIDETLGLSFKQYVVELLNLADLAINMFKKVFPDDEYDKITGNINFWFSQIFFNLFKNEITNIVETHDIDSLLTCSQIASRIQATSQFKDIFYSSFSNLIELVMRSDDLYTNIVILIGKMNEFNQILTNNSEKKDEKLIATFRKIYNKDPDFISKFLATKLNDLFLSSQNLDLTVPLFLFEMLNSKDTFEVYHTHLLFQRLVRNFGNMISNDINFIDNIKLICGEFYTERMDELLKGSSFSQKCYDAFNEEFEVPEEFSVCLIPASSVESFRGCEDESDKIKSHVKIPNCVAVISNQYFAFVRYKFPNRKYRWDLNMSSVEMRCASRDVSISCNAKVAAVILSFNGNEELSLALLMEITKMKEDELNEIIKVLSSKKSRIVSHNIKKIEEKVDINIDLNRNMSENSESGQLIKEENINTSFFTINRKLKNKHIIIPSLLTIEREKEKENIVNVMNNRLDCTIIHIMKQKKRLQKTALIAEVSGILGYPVEGEIYENRLSVLCRKFFLSIDILGNVAYLN